MFAIAATGAELRYGLTGPVSDSMAAPDSLNPTWTRIAFDRTKWYTVTCTSTSRCRRVQYMIATKETAAKVMASGTASVTGKNLAKLVACNYYGTGVQSIDNFRLTAPANPANGRLKGKTMYAFGDSIVYGHAYPRGFVNFAAEREQMNLTKYAVNGATVGPGDYRVARSSRRCRALPRGRRTTWCSTAAPTTPKRSTTTLYRVGTMAGGFDPATFDRSTYAGSFETTSHTMRTKVAGRADRLRRRPQARLPRLEHPTRDSASVTLQICAKWGVTVADVFNDTTLDTRIDSHRVAYTFNGLVNGYPGTGGTGTHPNIAAITAFYVPVLTAALT